MPLKKNGEVTQSYEVFYLSIGLYQNETHECFYHNVSGCEAEFKTESVAFHIKSQNSSYEVHGLGFTTTKGFFDFYLPKNETYFAEFEVKDLKGSGILTTNPDSPSCITTIRVA